MTTVKYPRRISADLARLIGTLAALREPGEPLRRTTTAAEYSARQRATALSATAGYRMRLSAGAEMPLWIVRPGPDVVVRCASSGAPFGALRARACDPKWLRWRRRRHSTPAALPPSPSFGPAPARVRRTAVRRSVGRVAFGRALDPASHLLLDDPVGRGRVAAPEHSVRGLGTCAFGVWNGPRSFGLEVAVDEETFELSLDPVLGAASEARRATRKWLADSMISGALLEDLQLVISELVTNAVIHARTPLRLVVHFDGHRVVTEVFDADTRRPTPAVSSDGVGGRGLMLVDRLSDRWGSESFADGKRVWAQLTIDD